MDRKNVWQNTTTKPSKGGTTYGLNSNKTSVSFIRTHELLPTPDSSSRNIIYLTFSTFDGEFVLLQDQYPTGKFVGNNLSFKEKVKMKTQYPIANCWLQHSYHNTSNRDNLIGYLVDIFSNIYSVNFTSCIEKNQKISALQPIVYTILTLNMCENYFKHDKIHYEYPLMFYKHNNIITLFNLGGQLKLLDTSQEKSWINAPVVPDVYQFGVRGLAGTCSSNKSSLGSVVILALENQQVPYVFVDCRTTKDYKQTRKLLDEFCTNWQWPINQITFCEFDSVSNLLAVSFITQEVQLYQIKRNIEGSSNFYHCQRLLRFFPDGHHYEPDNHIEYMNAGKGYLIITICNQYIIVNLKEKVVKKRGKGTKEKNKVQKLKWAQILDKQGEFIGIMLAKGYNHHNEPQSKLGKPNLHFKTMELKKQLRE